MPVALCLCCPACEGDLASDTAAYSCRACNRIFPILFGIADFRLESDAYLTLQEEREKARRLEEFGKTHGFEELLAFYYEITDDVPPGLARLYSGYVTAGVERADSILQELAPLPASRLLDLGCGAGGLIVAARQRALDVIGVDIALRWLVICKRRLEELGLDATLICAQAERLPFLPAAFSTVVAADLLENARDPPQVLNAAARQLAPEGTLWISSNNSWWIGPHPPSGVWAVAIWPSWLRSLVLRRVRGVDSLRNITLTSSRRVTRSLRAIGLQVVDRRPLQMRSPVKTASRSIAAQWAMRCYAWLADQPLARAILYNFGPAFEIRARRNQLKEV